MIHTYEQCTDFDSAALLQTHVTEYFEAASWKTTVECHELAIHVVANDNNWLLTSNDSP